MKMNIKEIKIEIDYIVRNNKMSTVTYNILNYEEIQRDVLARSKIIMDFKLIIERRIRIQSQYLQKMKELNAQPEMRKIPNATKASQFIYNSLVNAVQAQVDNITNHVSRMEAEVSKLLGTTCVDLDNEVKRELINSAIIVKQYDKKHQDIQKFRIKMVKKAHELRKLKEQYIVGTLIDMPFDKKNKLFIRTKQLEEVYKPLKQQYDHYAKLFNQKANAAAQKLKQIINRIQTAEEQKVELMKNVFMVLQISNSQYGANLIQDKASILSRIDKLKAANPEFTMCTEEAFEQSKKHLLNYQHDPCSYINNLFTNIIDTKNMHGLVMYGHQLKHRQSISESMTQQNQDGETQLETDDPNLITVKQIVLGFKNIFNQTSEFSQSKLQRLSQLMENSPEGRKNFILCLQKFRTLGKFTINQSKLLHIQCILNIFLDQCLNQFDTYNSKLLLVLSFTYYVIIDEKKTDLHFFIKQHKIWKQKQWWECALLESSYEQLKIKPPKKLQQVPITIWHIKGSGFKHAEGEHENTAQNVLFNQLIFYIQNMRLFDMKQEIITYFARKYTRYFQLPPKIAADIEPFLKIQDIQSEQLQFDMYSPTGSPLNFKKKSSKTRKFF